MNAPTTWVPPWIPSLVEAPETAGETLFLSDLHLGTGPDEAARLRDLRTLLESLPGRIDTLVLGGDVFEFWWEWKHAVPRRYMEFLLDLRRAGDSGTKLRFVRGNHDFAVGGFLSDFLGATIHHDGICLDVGGDRWLLVHGDGIARSDRADRVARRVLRSRVAQAAWNLVPPDLAFHLAGAVGRTSRAVNPGPAPNIEQYGEAAAEWIRRWNLAGVVHGHTHRPLLQPIGESFHVNNGDWLIGRSMVLISPKRRIRLIDYRKDGLPWRSST